MMESSCERFHRKKTFPTISVSGTFSGDDGLQTMINKIQEILLTMT